VVCSQDSLLFFETQISAGRSDIEMLVRFAGLVYLLQRL